MAQKRVIKQAAAPREIDILKWQDGRWFIDIFSQVKWQDGRWRGADPRRLTWAFAVLEAMEGNPSILVHHLRSRQKLTQADRNHLASLFEKVVFTDRLQYKPMKGRSKQTWTRSCANLAIQFYQDWKDANRRNGINDWGHGKQMKDKACQLAIEVCGNDKLRLYLGQDPPTFEQVRELIERPAARRR